MDKLINHVNTTYKNIKIHQLRDKIASLKNLLEAMDALKIEAIERRLKSLQKKHERVLYEMERQTLSNEAYAHEVLKPFLAHTLHQYHLKALRLKHTAYKKQVSHHQDILKLNDAFQKAIEEKYQKIIQKRTKIVPLVPFEKEIEDLHSIYLAYKNKVTNELEKRYTKKKRMLSQRLEAFISQRTRLLESVQDEQNKYQIKDNIILKVDHLSMHFGGLKAVDDLSFDVKKGEIFGLIGPNGAGKTTVFNCITQFYNITDGTLLFRNKEERIIELNKISVHHVIKEGIARTFQNVELIYELTILDNMLVGAHSMFQTSFFKQLIHSSAMKREEIIFKRKAIKILTDLGLYYYKDIYPIGLPYGILKKIELARVLMTNPSLIILDEPAAGLNDKETQDLAITIKKIQKEYETTIFLVEHDMGLVMDICDTICAISFGKKLAIGTPKEIKADPIVQEAYLGGAEHA